MLHLPLPISRYINDDGDGDDDDNDSDDDNNNTDDGSDQDTSEDVITKVKMFQIVVTITTVRYFWAAFSYCAVIT